MKKSLVILATFAGLSTVAFGQVDLEQLGQYPQFRTLSGLPGSGFGILPDGTPSFNGAMSFSTPIGYSLSNWHVAMDTANTSNTGLFKFIHLARNESTSSIGKAYFMFGIPLGRFGSFTASYWILSAFLDQALNFQYQLPIHWHNIGVSLGVQDWYGRVGTGPSTNPLGQYRSQSWYGAVTMPFAHGIYASAGWGVKRWQKGFFNVSVPIQKRFKFMLEHDGFNFNLGLAWDPQLFRGVKLGGRQVQSTLMMGLVRAKYAYWSLNFSF